MPKWHFLRFFQFCECSFFRKKCRNGISYDILSKIEPPKKCCFGIFYGSKDDRVKIAHGQTKNNRINIKEKNTLMRSLHF